MQFSRLTIASSIEWVLAICGLLLALYSNLGNDWQFSHTNAIAALIVSFAFILGVCGWGEAISRKIFRRGTERIEFLSVGMLFTLFAAYGWVASGFLTNANSWISPLCAFLGFLLAKFSRSAFSISSMFQSAVVLDKFIPSFAKFSQKSKMDRVNLVLLSIAFLLLFLTRSIQALQPNQHGDPLYYHLLAPQMWLTAGSHAFSEYFPLAYLASSWEYLYGLIGSSFLGTAGDGLIAGQITGQAIHLYLGFFLSGFILYTIFLNFGFTRTISSLACIAALTVRELQWTAALGKNDWGITALFLFSLYYLLDPIKKDSKRSYFFSVLFVSICFAARPGTIYSILGIWLPIFLFRVYGRRRAIGTLAVYSISGALIGLAPIYLRNFYFTGNPLFPFFENVFQTKLLAQSYIEYVSVYQGFLDLNSWPNITNRFITIAKQSLFLPFLAFVPLLWIVLSRTNRPSKRAKEDRDMCLFAMCTLVTILIFAVFAPSHLIIRYLGPTLPIAAALGVIIFFSWCAYLIRFRINTFMPYISFLVLAALLANSKIPVHVIKKFPDSDPPHQFILKHTGGPAKAWLRKNANPNELIVIAGESEAYYLGRNRFTVLTEHYGLDQIYRRHKYQNDALGFLREIHTKFGAKYYVESFQIDALSQKIRLLTRVNHRHAIAFRAGSAIIIDLSKI